MRHGRCAGVVFALLAGAGLAGHARAGVLAGSDSTSSLAVSGGTTTVYQAASDARVGSALTASADLVLEWSARRAAVRAYLEGSSTSEAGSVPALLPEANTDAGTALDRFRRGRVQLSELLLDLRLGAARRLTLGLVDPSGAFDQSRVASDENTQFLGTAFNGNPTIEFPDYTLGVLYEDGAAGATVLRAGVTSSNGLADNPRASYGQLVSVAQSGKGAFLIASMSRPTPRRMLRLGAWVRTGEHERLGGAAGSESNFGGYALAGMTRGPHRGTVRLGFANPRVSQAAAFAGLGYQFARAPYVLGAGLARTFLSGRATAPGSADVTQAEGYVRRRVAPGWFVTADVQWLRNSAFDATNSVRDRNVAVLGARLTALLE